MYVDAAVLHGKHQVGTCYNDNLTSMKLPDMFISIIDCCVYQNHRLSFPHLTLNCKLYK